MLRLMTSQEIAILAAFGFFILVLVAGVVIGLVRRRHPTFLGGAPEPPPVRFVPHWQMMLVLVAAAVVILAAILVPLARHLGAR